MRKALAWPFEFVHVLSAAMFFALAALAALLEAAISGHPHWLAKASKLSIGDSSDRFIAISTVAGKHAAWLAGAALIGALVAPFARGDGKKIVAWTRVVCAAATLVVVAMIWSGVGDTQWTGKAGLAAAATSTFTPWQVLAVATGVDLALLAFAVAGGAAKKAKSADKDK
jgi:hypothetical protein